MLNGYVWFISYGVRVENKSVHFSDAVLLV